jgi:SOS-response transcriptional repressor LexA
LKSRGWVIGAPVVPAWRQWCTLQEVTDMQSQVLVQSVETEIELDRRLRRGDVLIVEPRATVRDGEWIVAESDAGPCVGRYFQAAGELVLYSLAPGVAPARVRQEDLHVRGVVIGVKTSL